MDNTREVNQPFEATWNKLVGNLSNESFIVTIVDRASRSIDISFRTDDPGAYIDCGYFLTDSVSPAGTRERSQISVTDNAVFEGYRQYGATTSVSWKTGLRGRAVVLVVSFGERTGVFVDIEYAFIVKATYQRFNVFENPLGRPGTETTVTLFDTAKPSRGRASGKTVTCFSKGVLEQRILDAAS